MGQQLFILIWNDNTKRNLVTFKLIDIICQLFEVSKVYKVQQFTSDYS